MIENRKQDERDFAAQKRHGIFLQRWSVEGEKEVEANPLWTNFKYYSIERKSLEFVRSWLRERCPGKRVLDYGCGNGEESIFVAKEGAEKVVGIDISELTIENCKKRADLAGVAERTEFHAMDGEALTFEDDSFDLIMEYGVLHHIDLDRGMREWARVMKPDGQAVCTEALGHNPIIHLYRRMTPRLRTRWEVEHILTKKSFELISKYFGKIDMRFYHLATLAAVPFRNWPVFGGILGAMEAVDSVLLKIPGIRWQAWHVVFILSEPKSHSDGQKAV